MEPADRYQPARVCAINPGAGCQHQQHDLLSHPYASAPVNSSMRALIVGCGYVGLAAGAQLVNEGHEVFGLRRTSSGEADLKDAGIRPLIGDITRLPDLQKLPGPFDWVLNTVSSSKGGAGEYRQVYLQGMRNLRAWLSAAPPQKFVYTSSTSVYGQTDGSWVEETSPTEPASETGKILLQAEHALQHFPSIVLRVAGIYGPGRGYWLRQFLRGEAVITGTGQRILNMIHRDDVAGIIIAALRNGSSGEIYNAVDDEPVAQIDFFRWLATALDRPMPPFAPEPDEARRKRGFTDKIVSNRKVKRELGYCFLYPTFREGFKKEMERLEATHPILPT